MKKRLQNLAMCLSIFVGAQIHAQAYTSYVSNMYKQLKNVSGIGAQVQANEDIIKALIQAGKVPLGKLYQLMVWMKNNPGKTIGAGLTALGIIVGAKLAYDAAKVSPAVRGFVNKGIAALNNYKEKLLQLKTIPDTVVDAIDQAKPITKDKIQALDKTLSSIKRSLGSIQSSLREDSSVINQSLIPKSDEIYSTNPFLEIQQNLNNDIETFLLAITGYYESILSLLGSRNFGEDYKVENVIQLRTLPRKLDALRKWFAETSIQKNIDKQKAEINKIYNQVNIPVAE